MQNRDGMSPLYGAGPLTLSLDSGADPMLANLAGTHADVRGSDPASFARDLVASWSNPTGAVSDQKTSDGVGDKISHALLGSVEERFTALEDKLIDASKYIGAFIIGAALIIVGAYAFTQGGD